MHNIISYTPLSNHAKFIIFKFLSIRWILLRNGFAVVKGMSFIFTKCELSTPKHSNRRSIRLRSKHVAIVVWFYSKKRSQTYQFSYVVLIFRNTACELNIVIVMYTEKKSTELKIVMFFMHKWLLKM